MLSINHKKSSCHKIYVCNLESINNFRQPTRDFVERELFVDIKKALADQASLLHLYGFPGSGKSAIIRKLASEFPFNNDKPVVIKYLIECVDSNEDIDESLKSLLKRMWESSLIHKKITCDNAVKQLKHGRTIECVELIARAAVPVLIIIEDPRVNHLAILRDLMYSFTEQTFAECAHLVITSRSKERCDLPHLSTCKRFRVDGLTMKEGLKLLALAQNASETEKVAAEQVVTDLGGSPLGLIAVRAYCKKSRLLYKEYCLLRDFSHDKEIQNLKEEYGPHTKHLFQAVTTLLNENALWDTMKALSFFHHSDIPQRLIGSIKMKRDEANTRQDLLTHYKIKQKSGEFISRLENYAICDVSGNGYFETAISFHQVVFLAVQTYMAEKKEAFCEAVLSLASLLYVNIRQHSDYEFRRKMNTHVLSVLTFADVNPGFSDDFVTKMSVIHLREVYGNAAKYFDSVSAEQSLMKCAQSLWEDVADRSGTITQLTSLVHKQECSPAVVAQSVIKACLTAGKQLLAEQTLVDEYVSVVTHLKQDDYKALISCSKNEKLNQRLKEISDNSLKLTAEEIREIRNLKHIGLFLEIETHCKVFFIDRLVSTLYCLGRVMLYDSDVTIEKQRRFVWILDIVFELSEQCRQQTDVTLSFLRLSAVNRVTARLKNFAEVEVEKRKGILEDALVVVKSNLKMLNNQLEVPIYESGFKRPVEGGVFDEMLNLRALIRIYGKLIALCSKDGQAKVLYEKDSQTYYERLCKQARLYLERWILCPKCLVYSGKYMASLGKYEDAVNLFQETLSCKAITDKKADYFPWVCYNYARATVAGKLISCKSDAFFKCNEALKHRDDIRGNLASQLEEQRDLLSNI